jgi:hypothetical protein
MFTKEEILATFDEPGNAIAVDAIVENGFIKSVVFACDKPGCNCVGGWSTNVGRSVNGVEAANLNGGRRERIFTPANRR